MAELETAIDSLPLGKASGFDNLCYEHIKYRGIRLRTIILDLFIKIFSLELIPTQFKQGLIITLYKGHNKSSLNPDNYRAITLMPAMSKLFEKVLQIRIEKSNILNNKHPLQHGFQKGKSSKHVTFILQESSNYCQERHSPLYACFLDAAKAFDKVWIKGLLYKLFKLGFIGKDLRIFAEMFKDMKSRVYYQGLISEYVEIKQGTRQGSLLSPFFYTVF